LPWGKAARATRAVSSGTGRKGCGCRDMAAPRSESEAALQAALTRSDQNAGRLSSLPSNSPAVSGRFRYSWQRGVLTLCPMCAHRFCKGRYRPMRGSNAPDRPLGSAERTMNCATSSALAPATTNTFPPTGAGCSTSGGPRPCWPSYKPHDGTSPHVREHRVYLLARALTEPRRSGRGRLRMNQRRHRSTAK